MLEFRCSEKYSALKKIHYISPARFVGSSFGSLFFVGREKDVMEIRKVQQKLLIVIRYVKFFLHDKKFGIIKTFSLKEIAVERA